MFSDSNYWEIQYSTMENLLGDFNLVNFKFLYDQILSWTIINFYTWVVQFWGYLQNTDNIRIDDVQYLGLEMVRSNSVRTHY